MIISSFFVTKLTPPCLKHSVGLIYFNNLILIIPKALFFSFLTVLLSRSTTKAFEYRRESESVCRYPFACLTGGQIGGLTPRCATLNLLKCTEALMSERHFGFLAGSHNLAPKLMGGTGKVRQKYGINVGISSGNRWMLCYSVCVCVC